MMTRCTGLNHEEMKYSKVMLGASLDIHELFDVYKGYAAWYAFPNASVRSNSVAVDTNLRKGAQDWISLPGIGVFVCGGFMGRRWGELSRLLVTLMTRDSQSFARGRTSICIGLLKLLCLVLLV